MNLALQVAETDTGKVSVGRKHCQHLGFFNCECLSSSERRLFISKRIMVSYPASQRGRIALRIGHFSKNNFQGPLVS